MSEENAPWAPWVRFSPLASLQVPRHDHDTRPNWLGFPATRPRADRTLRGADTVTSTHPPGANGAFSPCANVRNVGCRACRQTGLRDRHRIDVAQLRDLGRDCCVICGAGAGGVDRLVRQRRGLRRDGRRFSQLTPRLAMALLVMLTLFASHVPSAIAMRYFNHASFIMAMPALSGESGSAS